MMLRLAEPRYRARGRANNGLDDRDAGALVSKPPPLETVPTCIKSSFHTLSLPEISDIRNFLSHKIYYAPYFFWQDLVVAPPV